MLSRKTKLSGPKVNAAAVFLLFLALNFRCFEALAVEESNGSTPTEKIALVEQLAKLSSLWKVDIVAKISPQNSLTKEVPMNDIQANDKSKVLDQIAIEHELGWGKLNDTVCFFALSELPHEPVNNPIDITRHRMTYAARFFANLPQSQLEQLRQGEMIRLEQLPKDALQTLQTLVDPEGYSLEAPRQGFFAVSLGFAPNFAVIKEKEVAPLFRVFLLPDAQIENVSAQNIDLQTTFEQTRKSLPTLKNQVRLSRSGLWSVTSLLKLIQDSGNIEIRFGDNAKDAQIFLSKTQWSAEELLKVVMVVTNTRLLKDNDSYSLEAVADPAEDLQTEQWLSHLCGQPRTGEIQSNERARGNALWSQLDAKQRKLINASLQLTPPMKNFLSHNKNREDSKFRFSSGDKLQIGYYQIKDGNEKSLVLKHSIDIPLFDPWISVDFFDQVGGSE